MNILKTVRRTVRLQKIVAVVELSNARHVLLLEGGHTIEVDEEYAENTAQVVRACDKIDCCELAEKGQITEAFFAQYRKEHPDDDAA